jgi:hypothetical protein
MYWSPKAFLVGTHSDWYGQWQVEIPGDDLTSEIINFHLCEGETHGDIGDDCDEAEKIITSWDVAGDMSLPWERRLGCVCPTEQREGDDLPDSGPLTAHSQRGVS